MVEGVEEFVLWGEMVEVVLWGEMVEVVLWWDLVLFLVDHVPAFAGDSQVTSRVKCNCPPSSVSEKT